MPPGNPSRSNKKRKRLTVKELQKKSTKTRQPTSMGRLNTSSTVTSPDSTTDKKKIFDPVNDANFCLGLRDIDYNSQVDTASIQQYLAVMHKSIKNNFGKDENSSTSRAGRAKKDEMKDNCKIDVVTTTNQREYPSIHDTQSYRCLVEDYMVIAKDTSLLVLIPTNNRRLCDEWKNQIKQGDLDKISIMKNTYHQVICVVTRTPSHNFATQGTPKGDRVVHFEEQGSFLQCAGGQEKHLTWSEVLAGQKDGLQVWKKGVSKRDPYTLLRYKKSETTLYHLLHALSCEMFGDVIQTLKLLLAHKRVTFTNISATNSELKGKIMQIEQTCDIKLQGRQFVSVVNKVDDACKKAIDDCYNDFQSLIEPILQEK